MSKKIFFMLLGVFLLTAASTSLAAVVDSNNITATASDEYTGAAAYVAQFTVDGTGMDANGLLHTDSVLGMWFAYNPDGNSYQADANTESGPAWIQYEFKQTHELDELWVWNCNMQHGGLGYSERGLRNVSIEYSTDGSSWTKLGSYEFTEGPNEIDYAGFEACDFSGASAKYVVITANDVNGNWGDATSYILSEVRFYGTSEYATYPGPADDELDVAVDANLGWTAGSNAADTNGHEVYFGTDYDDVDDANTSVDPNSVYQAPSRVQHIIRVRRI